MIRVVISVIVLMLAVEAAPLENRIVNGTEVAEGEIPYIISLQYEGVGHSCGGSIISKEWILTAAHCVYQRSIPEFLVQFGTLSSVTDLNHSTRLKTIKIHPNYVHDEELGVPNDLALLQVRGFLRHSNEAAFVATEKKKFRIKQKK